MEAIKDFDIEIDLSQCKRLYDYGRREFIDQPAEGWDLKAITDAFRQAPEISDETAQYMLKKTDAMFCEKGCFEKVINNDEDKSEGENLTFSNFGDDTTTKLPYRVLPLFKPGDIVKGQLKLELTESIEPEEIRLKFKGHAATRIKMYNGQTCYDVYGSTEYVKDTVTFWRHEDVKDSDKKELLSTLVKTGKSLAPGKYSFPFDFRIPSTARQSAPPLERGHCSGNYAHIVYYVKATIDQGKRMKRGNILTIRGLWVEKPVDIASNPENLQPVVQEQTQSTGLFGSGKIVCRATLPTMGCVRGSHKEIPLKLSVDNQSGGQIDSVKAYVILKCHYRTSGSKFHGSGSATCKGIKAQGGSIGDGMCPEIMLNIPLEFPNDGIDSNLIPAGTLEDCDIIDVQYHVNVLLKRKGLHRNMEFQLPIFIGTENSKDAMYPSLSGLSIK